MYLDTTGNATKVGYYNGSAWNYGLTVLAASTSLDGGPVTVTNSTPSTLTTNGALVVAGGVGIGGVVNASNYRATGANGGPATQTTILDHSSGDGRVIVYGPDTATAGSFSMIGLSSNGSVGGSRFTISSTGAATFAGAVTIAGTVIHNLSATPASASATGTVGTMSWDANYIYICTATNTWKRVAIATW
jgi:hypothetical protein